MKIQLFIIFIACITIKCNLPDRKESGEVYVLKPKLVEKSLVLSSYIYDLEFIPLEDHAENFLRYANKILIKDSLIINGSEVFQAAIFP